MAKKSLGVGVLSAAGFLMVLIVPALRPEIGNYFAERMIEGTTLELTGKDTFLVTNWAGAIDGFLANPIFGLGYGAEILWWGETYEVHSTYLKFLGEGGLLVSIPALLLFFYVLSQWRKVKKREPNNFGYIAGLLCFGLFVCMLYTYLPRRREFWILMAVLCAWWRSLPTAPTRRIVESEVAVFREN